ncbi:MAG: lytic transglycosylase domain-containing protein [Qipengyuania sp.]
MSSMGRNTLTSFALLAGSTLAFPSVTHAQDATTWDRARAQMVASQSGQMSRVIERWQYLQETNNLGFETYASFILANPGFPQQDALQRKAENSLDTDPVTTERLVAFFDKHPPLTNAGLARYALALAAHNRPEAFDKAREAWRGGTMSGPSEAYLLSLYGSRLTPADHDARMDALLWQGDSEAAARNILRVSPQTRDLAMARLALAQGEAPQQAGLQVPPDARSSPGYVYALSRHYRSNGQMPNAIALLANRPNFTGLPFNAEKMVTEMLTVAKAAGAEPAVRIAASVDDLFPAGTDISRESYRLRDDYTSLMWLGGTQALWQMGDGKRAAPLFYRYGAAAQTPQTRSKGFYWAGRAARQAGDAAEAQRYWEMAAGYPERFYGQLALNELGRPASSLAAENLALPTPEQRAAFNQAPLTNAVREVARNAPWRTGIQFYRAISQAADTPEEHALVAQLARETGRRDLAVNVAEASGADGLSGFVAQGFPMLSLPQGADFTLVHAIARQESQFAENAISHAGARGLMQLMPATAQEEAGKAGVAYMTSSLIDDPQYNIRLGSNHIQRLVARYDGSYPLAFAAYNAGPGNVNKWLRENGDPRNGSISWVEWIEKIPFFETKNYVQRVVENAAVYEQLYPERTPYKRARMVHEFLR